MILNGATSIWADHLTLAMPAFAAARLLTGRAHPCSPVYIVFGSVVDPESDLDPVGSETFCRIRKKSFRIRIRAALTLNEFETKLL